MNQITTIAKRISEGLERRDLKQSDLVAATGIGKSSISTYISGEYEPKQRNIYKIAKALDVSESWLMGYDVPMERSSIEDTDNTLQLPDNIIPLPKASKQIPLLGYIACGLPLLAVENIDEFIPVPDFVHADFALRCQGDSMINARILDGDIVYIRKQPDVENGEIAAVLIDCEATLKRVYKAAGSMVLQPENPQFQPIVLVGPALDEVRILGKAVYFVSGVR